MKRTPLKPGKKDRKWAQERSKLVKLFREKGIMSCEVKLFGCTGIAYTGFAHRHERSWYYSRPKLLGDFKQILLVCSVCHLQIDTDKDLRERIFKTYRGCE